MPVREPPLFIEISWGLAIGLGLAAGTLILQMASALVAARVGGKQRGQGATRAPLADR